MGLEHGAINVCTKFEPNCFLMKNDVDLDVINTVRYFDLFSKQEQYLKIISEFRDTQYINKCNVCFYVKYKCSNTIQLQMYCSECITLAFQTA